MLLSTWAIDVRAHAVLLTSDDGVCNVMLPKVKTHEDIIR